MIFPIPGATPQSTIAVTFFSLASAFNSNEFSGKKEISITFFSVSMIFFKVSKPKNNCTKITDSMWMRAKHSGMFKATISVNTQVKKGDILGHITDPYGSFNHFVKAPSDGYIFTVNQSPIIYQGDAIFHISTKLES